MTQELLKSKEFDEQGTFLSEITGLQITYSKKFLELNSMGPGFIPQHRVPFNYDLTLGNTENSYKLNFNLTFTDEHSRGDWLPEASWKIQYNNKEIYNQGGMVNCSKELHRIDFQNRKKVEELVSSEFKHAIGGPDTEYAFMNYEDYTLESLKDRDRYFEDIYLVIMTHMKERGITMPPILSKRDFIRDPMLNGDVKKVNQILSTLATFEGGNFPKHVLAHMRYEANVIRSHAVWEAKKKNHSIPLSEAFPYANVQKIEKGRSIFPNKNILAVENDLRNYGSFTRSVMRSMESDGRYKGSQIISEVNLPDCMELCKSGRIDVILFDWTNPSHEEVLMVEPEARNPIYDMYYGQTLGSMGFEDDEMKVATPDGDLLDWDGMKKKSEKVDIRNRWMDMIDNACNKAGVQTPPFFIVRSTAEFPDLAKIVSQKLGKSIS